MFTHGAPRSSQELIQKCLCIQDQIGIWKCWFLKRVENRSTWRKTSWSRVENQQLTQPTYDTRSGNRTWDTLVGGERSHCCALTTVPSLLLGGPCRLLLITFYRSGLGHDLHCAHLFLHSVPFLLQVYKYLVTTANLNQGATLWVTGIPLRWWEGGRSNSSLSSDIDKKNSIFYCSAAIHFSPH